MIGDVATDCLAGLLGLEYESLSHSVVRACEYLLRLCACLCGFVFVFVLQVLGAVAAGVLLPLCLLPSLAPLGTASVLGVAGIGVTGGAMLARLLHSKILTRQHSVPALAIPTSHESNLCARCPLRSRRPSPRQR